jgi:1-acyl-sn-glycerol-3-phosphate acyltransferase
VRELVDGDESTDSFYAAAYCRPVNSVGVGRRDGRDVSGTVLGWIVIVTMTVLFGTAALITSWIPPRGRLFLFWARGWSRVLLALCGIPHRIEVSGGAAAAPQAVFMSNHESLVDIPLLFVGIRQNVRFLAKRSLFFVPFLGWSMWLAGFVPVDRRRTEKAADVFQTLERRVRAGLSMLVFPEGTRSRSGALQPFKRSGFLLAIRTGLPVIPVAVSGARNVIGADSLWIRRVPVTIRFGEPIPTAGLTLSDQKTLRVRVRREILRLRGTLPPAAPGLDRG